MPPPPPTASGPAQHPQLALRPRTTRNQSVQDRQVREATTLYFFRRQPFDTTPRPALTQLALDRLAGRRSTSRSVRLRAIGWSCAIPRLRHVLPAPCLACAATRPSRWRAEIHGLEAAVGASLLHKTQFFTPTWSPPGPLNTWRSAATSAFASLSSR